MGYWQIIVAAGATNLCLNPSFETNTTSWAAVGTNTIAASTEQAMKGVYSLKCTYGDSAQMADYAVTLTTSTVYHVSCRVYVSTNWDGADIQIGVGNMVGASTVYNHIYDHGVSPTGEWVYLESKITVAADAAGNIYVEIPLGGAAPTAGRFIYVDCFQIEVNTTYATTYIDGDQAGCEWNGTRHGSTSTREAQSRAGGAVYDLHDDLGIEVIDSPGAGMAPVTTNSQAQALLPGALYSGYKVEPREFILAARAVGTSIINLHTLRKRFINYIKPDAVKGAQPFLLRYSGGDADQVVEIECVYAGGLEWNKLEGYSEEFAISLIAFYPFYHALPNGFTALATGKGTITSTQYVIQRLAGIWQIMGTGFNGEVDALALSPSKVLYAGGVFHLASGATVNHIAKWNGTAWSALDAAPGLNDVVKCLAFAPNGDLYIGGSFTDITGGVGGTYNRIVRWDGTNWNALGVGADNAINDMVVGLDGTLYVAGEFHNIGGGAAVHIAKWDGSAWSALGAGVDAGVSALAIHPNGDLYVGGSFANAGGAGAAKIAKWNGTAWSALGTGLDNNCTSLTVSNSGIVYAGGLFHAAGGNTAMHIAYWNGSAWYAFPDEPDAAVYKMAFSPSGDLYATGVFTAIGSMTIADRIARWNGYTWAPTPLNLPGTPYPYGLEFDGDDIFVGFDTTGDSTGPVNFTCTNNGTCKAWPVIEIKRVGGLTAVLQYVRNHATLDTLVFNYAILDGETVTIDCRPGNKKITSDFFGDVARALLPNSDFAEFCLIPGANSMSLFVSDTSNPTISIKITWQTEYWSFDGAAP